MATKKKVRPVAKKTAAKRVGAKAATKVKKASVMKKAPLKKGSNESEACADERDEAVP